MTFQPSPLDSYVAAIQLYLNQGLNYKQIAEQLKVDFEVETSETSVRRAIDRHGLERPERTATEDKAERPGVTFNDKNEATVTSGVMSQDELDSIQLGDIEVILRNRGIDPKDWIVERVTVNEWDGNGGRPAPGEDPQIITLRQLKIQLKRRIAIGFVVPAVHVPTQPRPKRAYKWDNARLAITLGDEQEPFSDPYVHESILSMLEDLQPDILVHLGDLTDLPDISRHKDNPEWTASVQDCINAGYARLLTYVEAAPNSERTFMIGNHEERLRAYLLNRAERVYGVRPADKAGEDQAAEVLGPRNLLHLDELGFDFIDPKGGYAHAQVSLSDKLAIRHGWLTGDNTAGKTLDRLGHSVIVGHTHSQRMVYKTLYNMNGSAEVLVAVENGTLSQVDNGLGFCVNPNWQQGCTTATIWDDDGGDFRLDQATFTGGKLRWRDKRY